MIFRVGISIVMILQKLNIANFFEVCSYHSEIAFQINFETSAENDEQLHDKEQPSKKDMLQG